MKRQAVGSLGHASSRSENDAERPNRPYYSLNNEQLRISVEVIDGRLTKPRVSFEDANRQPSGSPLTPSPCPRRRFFSFSDTGGLVNAFFYRSPGFIAVGRCDRNNARRLAEIPRADEIFFHGGGFAVGRKGVGAGRNRTNSSREDAAGIPPPRAVNLGE